MSIGVRGLLGLSLYKLSAAILLAPAVSSQKSNCNEYVII